MTVSQTWRRALLAGAAVPALALTACSLEGTGVGGATESADGAESADGDEPDESEMIADLDLDGAPDDFTPTEPGTELDYDEAGYVVTRPGDGQSAPLQFWKITAQDTDVLDAGEVPLTEGEDDVENFLCLTYEVTLLGTGPTQQDADRSSEDPAVPAVYPADDEGAAANVVEQADPSVCGVDEEDALPADPADIEEGTTYDGAVLSYVDKERTRGINATGLAFTYDLEAGQGDSRTEDLDAEPVRWN